VIRFDDSGELLPLDSVGEKSGNPSKKNQNNGRDWNQGKSHYVRVLTVQGEKKKGSDSLIRGTAQEIAQKGRVALAGTLIRHKWRDPQGGPINPAREWVPVIVGGRKAKRKRS